MIELWFIWLECFNAKAEGSQTAGPEAGVAEPVEKKGENAHNDEGKSTIDIVREVIAEQLAVKLADLEADTAFVDLGADSLDTVSTSLRSRLCHHSICLPRLHRFADTKIVPTAGGNHDEPGGKIRHYH